MCHDPFDPQHWRWCTSNNSTKLGIHYVVVVCVCLGLTSFSAIISRQCLVATGISILAFIMLPHPGIKSQTLYLIPPQSHNTDSPSPTPKILVPSGEQLVTLSTTLVCRGPGWNPVPPDLGADTLHTALQRTVRGCTCSARHLQHELVWT